MLNVMMRLLMMNVFSAQLFSLCARLGLGTVAASFSISFRFSILSSLFV